MVAALLEPGRREALLLLLYMQQRTMIETHVRHSPPALPIWAIRDVYMRGEEIPMVDSATGVEGEIEDEDVLDTDIPF
ncbi:hypothetical protein LZ554_009192 [Drepanopeziza brunnea f. sp. 'monogermtubi']|nr:hypothetical protein LZ554_009192 [Drepanopeziza brunnea f. sp. 'monogermtubi']